MRINQVKCDRCDKSENYHKTEGVPKDWFELFSDCVTWHLCLECGQRALERIPEKGKENDQET